MDIEEQNKVEDTAVSVGGTISGVAEQKIGFNWKLLSLTLIAVVIGVCFVAAAFYYKGQQNLQLTSGSVFNEDKGSSTSSEEEGRDNWALSETKYYTYYGDGFYRKDNKVFADKSDNNSINNLELTEADPDSFSFLQGLAGYDKDNFHYLRYDDEARTYVPESVPISPAIKQLFDSVESPGRDVKIVWTSNTDVVFENVTYRKMTEYENYNAFRIGIYELLNNENVVGFLWVNGISKTNVVNNKLYLYTDSSTTDFVEAVYEVSYGNQPEMIIDIESSETTFKPGGSKIYYTKSYDSLDFYEFDTVTKTERQIPVQYQSTTTSSSRVTLSPDEKYLLVKSNDGYTKTSTMLVDIVTGNIEIVRENEVTRFGGDFPFAISPSNDKVFFLNVPYEGYMFSAPFYVKKDAVTGVWGNKIELSSINMEVGGGWNIDTGQWSISPSGRYIAVADATENSIYSCVGMLGTPRAHNVIKIFDLETLETQILTIVSPDEDFTLNSWVLDESGMYATKRKVEMNQERPELNCGRPTGEGTQDFYPR